MAATFERVERAVIQAERVFIFLAFISLVLFLFLQVIFRFVLESPLDFTEEAARVVIVWLVFVGAASAVPKAEHFVVDLVMNLMPARLSSTCGYVVDVICIGFMGTAAWVSYDAAMLGGGQTLPALQMSILVQTLAMPVGFTLMTLHAVLLVLRRRHVGDPASVREADPAIYVESEGGTR